MKTSVRLAVRLESWKTSRALASVLSADNRVVPRGLTVRMEAAREMLAFEVESESIATALSTVSAVLRDIALFQQVWLLSSISRA